MNCRVLTRDWKLLSIVRLPRPLKPCTYSSLSLATSHSGMLHVSFTALLFLPFFSLSFVTELWRNFILWFKGIWTEQCTDKWYYLTIAGTYGSSFVSFGSQMCGEIIKDLGVVATHNHENNLFGLEGLVVLYFGNVVCLISLSLHLLFHSLVFHNHHFNPFSITKKNKEWRCGRLNLNFT